MLNLDTHLERLYDLGVAAYDADRFAAAAELLAPYLRHRSDHGYAWFLYGDALRVLGLAHEAERALDRSSELCPRQPWPRVRLAMVKEQLGHRDAAEADYAAVADHPGVAAAGWYWIVRGANLASLGQLRSAEWCQRTAIGCGPDDLGEAYANLGHVLRAGGRYTEATWAYQQALVADPGCDAARTGANTLDGVADAVLTAALLPVRD